MTERSFLGYGSPEALEKAITAGEGDDFTVYGEGLLYASVCSSLPPEEVKRRMGTRPSGTRGGWQLSENKTFRGGQPNPCPCDDHPQTHKHYLFVT